LDEPNAYVYVVAYALKRSSLLIIKVSKIYAQHIKAKKRSSLSLGGWEEAGF
jgi:hypothetical protein